MCGLKKIEESCGASEDESGFYKLRRWYIEKPRARNTHLFFLGNISAMFRDVKIRGKRVAF